LCTGSLTPPCRSSISSRTARKQCVLHFPRPATCSHWRRQFSDTTGALPPGCPTLSTTRSSLQRAARQFSSAWRDFWCATLTPFPRCVLTAAGHMSVQICQLGNFSIHIALRNLRPPGTKERRIPMPTGAPADTHMREWELTVIAANPFTWLFRVVSCPNYTYEIGSWLFFNVAAFSLSGPSASGACTFVFSERTVDRNAVPGRRGCADDCLGAGKTSQLSPRVQGLSPGACYEREKERVCVCVCVYACQ
jgi:hypothetical protein